MTIFDVLLAVPSTTSLQLAPDVNAHFCGTTKDGAKTNA
jgi:hypothetical protein